MGLDAGSTTFDTYRKTIDSFKPDIIFGLLRYPWAVRKVSMFLDKYHPTVALNWFQEDPNGITGDLLAASSSFDYWFTQDLRTVPFWPTKAFFSPHAFDETVYFERNLPRVFDISFVGKLGHELSTQMYWPYMKELFRYGKKAFLALERPMDVPLLPYPFEQLLRHRKLRPLWQKIPFWRCVWKEPSNEAEKAIVINRSKIHFGLNRVRGFWEESVKSLLPAYAFDKHGIFCQTKGRLFQSVGAGAMVLTDYVFELEEMFDIGKEIVTFEFDNLEDFREKLSWYLSHDNERERIAQAGYRRGHRHHTFTARIQQIFDVIRKDP